MSNTKRSKERETQRAGESKGTKTEGQMETDKIASRGVHEQRGTDRKPRRDRLLSVDILPGETNPTRI